MVESLEAEVSRIETELSSLRTQLAADHGVTGTSCTRWPIANASWAISGPAHGDWEKASAELQRFLEEV